MSERSRQASGLVKPSADRSGRAADQGEVSLKLSEAAREFEGQDGTDETLRTIVAAAIALIPGAEDGSINVVVARRHVSSQAPSSELARTIDALQQEAGEGPCLDTVYEQQTVRVDDMGTERRWPAFAERAAAAGVGSLMSFQLYVTGDNLGALNLYAASPGVFDEESEHIGLLFAAHAAVAYAAAKRESQLLRAVSTRELIGQAQGILMERHKITADQAFGRLVQASQSANVKLREVAEQLVETGQEPDTPLPA